MQEKQVQIEHDFKVAPEQIFNAWIRPQWIKKWMFKSGNNQILHVINDVRSNGVFSILEKTSDGEMIDHFGKYHLIEKPYYLSFSLEVPKHFKGVTMVDITIEPKKDGSRLTFHQTGVDPKLVEESWHRMFNALDTLFSSPKELLL